ncbi:hypothetical protein HYV57_05845 [Candidatus Peregrinibacteria bacterium]|nr:hypothetical protein [Candidatus Peregrinibacteria bacterium]
MQWFFEKFRRICVYCIVVVIFSVTAFSMILVANGYQYDFSQREVVQTGLLSVQSSLKVQKIVLDDKVLVADFPFQESLLSGMHTLRLEHSAFYPWKKSFSLQKGFVAAFDHPVFIPKDIFSYLEKIPADETYASYLSQNFLASRDTFKNIPPSLSPNEENELSIRGYELWTHSLGSGADFFVTRFSHPIQRAAWYFDSNHIVVLVDSDLYFLDSDGQNVISWMNIGAKGTFRMDDDSRTILLYDEKNAWSLDLERIMKESL